MIGIPELFAELDGRDRYEQAIEIHIHWRRYERRLRKREEYARDNGKTRKYQRDYYRRPGVADRQLAQKRERYRADAELRARKSARAKARYHALRAQQRQAA